MIKKFENPIYITQPLIPNRKDLYKSFDEVIDAKYLTNMGHQHKMLERALSEYLGVKNLLLFNNGTIALMTALKALDLPIGSEVITTPFTFVATTHSIAWNNLKPVFVDIEPKTMTICPKAIEKSITKNTSAILPVHVYGFPCFVDEIQKIAQKYNLKVIYDSAHAFTTKIKNESICNFGDITMLSLHATKLFNSIEGGALVFNDDKLYNNIYELRNFGIKKIKKEDAKYGISSGEIINDIGINGKMNELQAAWGRCTLQLVKQEQEKRLKISEIYKQILSQIKGIKIPKIPENTTNSCQYFPIIIEANCKLNRDAFYQKLTEYNIFTRKYFYPLCSSFEIYKKLPSSRLDDLPKANKIADNILCLPFYGELLDNSDIYKICDVIKTIF